MSTAADAFFAHGPRLMLFTSNNYGLFQVLFVALSVLLYFPVCRRISRSPIRIRKRWHSIAQGTIFGMFVLSFVPYFYVDSSNSAESFALASILVTLFASIIPNLYSPFEDRMKIHVAIPSLRPFNMAMRSGLYQRLSESSTKYVVSDDRSSIPNNEENHARLNDLVFDALRAHADFLIVHPATETAANDTIFVKLLKKLMQRGCYVFCIENFPGDSSDLYMNDTTYKSGRLLKVQSDSRAGAAVLAAYIRTEHSNSFADNSAHVILLSGPLESRNAKIRRDILHQELSEAPYFSETPSLWWGFSSGRRAMIKILTDLPKDERQRHFIIVAANDDMALGACSAITACDGTLPPITLYGYDGILPARYAIGQNTTPFAATVHLEPEQYGKRICETILSIADGDSDIEDIFIPISSSKIKDEARCGEELGLS